MSKAEIGQGRSETSDSLAEKRGQWGKGKGEERRARRTSEVNERRRRGDVSEERGREHRSKRR
jgi:hypothetical protein